MSYSRNAKGCSFGRETHLKSGKRPDVQADVVEEPAVTEDNKKGRKSILKLSMKKDMKRFKLGIG